MDSVAVAGKTALRALGELLSPVDILLDVQAATKKEAIGHLAGLLAAPAGARMEDVAAALLRRERLGATYIGDRIAMPHGRVSESAAPAAAVIRLRHPVDCGTTEGDAVDLLVGIAWPDAQPTGLLPTLAGIWRLLRGANVARAVREASTPKALHLALAAPGDRERLQ